MNIVENQSSRPCRIKSGNDGRGEATFQQHHGSFGAGGEGCWRISQTSANTKNFQRTQPSSRT
ncbi:hypothetical protein [Roseibium algae]|uniref:hypothetical protein n=1 Tax=Roseibium algae TaxID=3123038 RepID=UPI0030EF4588